MPQPARRARPARRHRGRRRRGGRADRVAPSPGLGVTGVAAVAALATFALVYGLAWRGGLQSDRLVLIGVGVCAAATALTTFVVVASDPWNTNKALTWLSGSTYGRTLGQVAPVAWRCC